MIKEMVEILENATVDKLVELVNREINSVKRDSRTLFTLSLAIVRRVCTYYKFRGQTEEALSSAVTSLTYMLLTTTEEVTRDHLESIIKKEVKQVSIDMLEPELAENSDFYKALELGNSYSVRQEVAVHRYVNLWNQFLPKRFKPIIQLYLDWGVVMVEHLDLTDRILVTRILEHMGAIVTDVDIKAIQDLIPKTNTEKMMFLSILAEHHPELFLLLTSIKDIGKFFTFLELLNGRKGFPKVSKVVSILEAVRKNSVLDSIKSDIFQDNVMLAVMLDGITFDPDSIGFTFADSVRKVIKEETSIYLGALDKLANRVDNDPSVLVRMYSIINTEEQHRAKMIDRLRKV